MSAGLRSETADRLALTALCLLLALSVATRMLPHGVTTAVAGAADQVAAVDFGEGIVLPRNAFEPRFVLRGPCRTPIPVEFVEPSPHGVDASLAGPQNAGDRTFYAYRGWILGGRYATTALAIRHFLWRGASVLRLNGTAGRDRLAVKLIMPAGCEIAPEDVMTTLRREIQTGW